MRKFALSNDYVTYLNEVDYDFGDNFDDPATFTEVMKSSHASLWYAAVEEELNSMAYNGVWTLVENTDNVKPIGNKWVFKTKRDSKGNIEWHKAWLVAKGFTQKECLYYTETFSPVSTKDSFRIIIVFAAQFNLKLHQMDVKTAFLNGSLDETIYMK